MKTCPPVVHSGNVYLWWLFSRRWWRVSFFTCLFLVVLKRLCRSYYSHFSLVIIVTRKKGETFLRPFVITITMRHFRRTQQSLFSLIQKKSIAQERQTQALRFHILFTLPSRVRLPTAFLLRISCSPSLFLLHKWRCTHSSHSLYLDDVHI